MAENKTMTMVDTETGQVYEVSSFRTPEQDKAYKNKKQLEKQEYQVRDKQDKSQHFTFLEKNMEGLEEMDNQTLGRFLIMQAHADYNSILKIDSESKAPMTRKELQDILGVSRGTMYKVINEFKAEGLLKEEKRDFYNKKKKAMIITDKYSFKKSVSGDNSNRSTKDTVKLFVQELKELAGQESMTATSIGFIYRVLPYINYSSNYLLTNPDVQDLEQADFITVGQLAEVQSGMTRSTVQQRLTDITWNGMYVFGRMKVGNNSESKIKVNPLLLTRLSGKTDKNELAIEFYVKNTKKRKK